MSINGRAKGKTGEREVAKIFAEWWGELEPGCKFVSTPLSGGFSTPAMRGDMKVAGDLCTNAKKWPFTVEVKRREGWNLKRLFAGKPSPVWAWWRQCVRAAREEGRVPLLMFRKNRDAEWMLMVPRGAFPDVPCFDNWALVPLNVDVAGCAPMVTTWDAFKHTTTFRGITHACRAFVLPPDLTSSSGSSIKGAPLSERQRNPVFSTKMRQPPLPLPGLDLPPQPGASKSKQASSKPSETEKLQVVGSHLAGARLVGAPSVAVPKSAAGSSVQTKGSARTAGAARSKRATGSTSAGASSAKRAGGKPAAPSLRLVRGGKATPSPSGRT